MTTNTTKPGALALAYLDWQANPSNETLLASAFASSISALADLRALLARAEAAESAAREAKEQLAFQSDLRRKVREVMLGVYAFIVLVLLCALLGVQS